MGNRENVLGHGLGDEVKKFGKDVMETQSTECGFICYWSKHINILVLKGDIGLVNCHVGKEE